MRELNGWSRLRLAHVAGLGHWDVIKIEAGKLEPTEDQLRAMTRAMGWNENDWARLMEVVDEGPAMERLHRDAADKMSEFWVEIFGE